MLALTTCCRSFRKVNCYSQHVFKAPLLGRLRSFTSPGTVNYIYSSSLSVAYEKRMRKRYKAPDDFHIIYEEPKSGKNAMIFAKAAQLFIYTTPLLMPAKMYWNDVTLLEFMIQKDFMFAAVLFSAYMVVFHYLLKSYVEAIFYNPQTKTYRVYLFKHFSIGLRYTDFVNSDLKSAKLSDKIPMARSVFKLGKEYLVLYDNLFINKEVENDLTEKALREFDAARRK